MKMRFLFLCLIGILSLSHSYTQEEYIKSFDVQVTINKDRSIDVTEYISVVTQNRIIKRGITRNIPLNRKMRSGKSTKLNIDITSIERDGKKENYHTDEIRNELVLYLGNQDVILKPGTYEYKIQYSIPGQVDFFDDYDELYWNAIGTDVQFRIEQASCRVKLPSGAKIIQEAAYVGKLGENFKFYDKKIEQSRILDYRLTRALQPKEGFAFAIGFEKGVINPVNLFQKFGSLFIILLSILLILPYYFLTWFKHGRDPQTPASYPIYDAPDNLSPASLSYILKEGYKSNSFTSTIISLAIKGYLRIDNEETKKLFGKSNNYSLTKLNDIDPKLPNEEVEVFNTLFKTKNTVNINGTYIPDVEKANADHREQLKYLHDEFLNEGNNRKYLWAPVLLTLVGAIGGIIIWENSPNADQINFYAILVFALLSAIGFFLYMYLIKRPSENKLELKSRIKGFKLYLEMAEKDRLNLLNPPEMTPEHFEHILPYAYALGVEHYWSNLFKTILDEAKYQPSWNSSHVYYDNNFGPTFTRDVARSSTDPAKSGSGSGGSGGGGFSGGGGGGGGVGGW